MPPTSRPLISPAQAVTYLAKNGLVVTDETLRRWADDRKIAHVRLPSGQVRFRHEDLDALLVPVQPEPSKAAS